MRIEEQAIGLNAIRFTNTPLSSASTGKTDTSFQSALAAAQAAQEASSKGPATFQTQDEKAEAAQAAREALWAEFREYMDKTPAEQMREQVLKELGITEEELAAMPPEKRLAMEDEIADRIKEKLLGQQQNGTDDDPLPALASSQDSLDPMRSQLQINPFAALNLSSNITQAG